jgi:hypothetical protein
MSKYGWLLAAVAVCALASPAEAVERQGLVLGFSAGGGVMTCDGCDNLGSFGFDFHIGGMIGDRVAVLAEGYGLAHPEDGSTLSSIIGGGALQLWPSDAFWVKGGVGVGQLEVDSGKFSLRSESAFAVMAAAGVEIVRGHRFVLDLQGRYGTTFFDDGNVNNFSAHVGFNWY